MNESEIAEIFLPSHSPMNYGMAIHLPFPDMFHFLFSQFLEKHWTVNLDSFSRLQFSFQ